MVAKNHAIAALIALSLGLAGDLALVDQASADDTAMNDATRTLMFCARNMAARLEPSGDPPSDVAEAAVFLCLPEESAAVNLWYKAGSPNTGANPDQLRGTALFYAKGQAVISRLCRKTKDCMVPPPPASPLSLRTTP